MLLLTVSFPLYSNNCCAGQTEVLPANGAEDAEDFLARERALLGQDADQFATPQDHVAAAAEEVDDGDDLLGGAETAPTETAAPEELAGFESSFPAIETQNEVRTFLSRTPPLARFVPELQRTNRNATRSKLHLAAQSPEPAHPIPQLAIRATENPRRNQNQLGRWKLRRT